MLNRLSREPRQSACFYLTNCDMAGQQGAHGMISACHHAGLSQLSVVMFNCSEGQWLCLFLIVWHLHNYFKWVLGPFQGFEAVKEMGFRFSQGCSEWKVYVTTRRALFEGEMVTSRTEGDLKFCVSNHVTPSGSKFVDW